MKVDISPAPSDDEVAAIVAAVEALWPRPVVFDTSASVARVPNWRFSNRWWVTPLVQRRLRPHR